MHAAAAVVNVEAVRLIGRTGQLRSYLAQNAWSRFVSGAIPDIHCDAHFLERHSFGKTRFDEFHVTAERVIDARRATNVVRGRPNRIDLASENEIFDFFLDLVIQLVTVMPEKLDAVVLVRIMRGRQNDARVSAQ